MNRCVLALAGLLALPVCAAAQSGGMPTAEQNPLQLPHSRFAVTPFIGVRVPYTTGTYHVSTEDGGQYAVEQDREGGWAAGVNGEAFLNRSLGAIVGFTYSSAGQDIYRFVGRNGTADSLEADGPTYWMAKAGMTWRLPDPVRDTRRFHPSAIITVAPALVVADYGDIDGFPELSGSSTSFALNLGADAVARLGSRGKWAISVGLEDYVTFWNQDDQVDRETFIWSGLTNDVVTVDYDYGTSNIFLIKLGVSYRM
jgi:hypothetical protein